MKRNVKMIIYSTVFQKGNFKHSSDANYRTEK